MFTFGQTAAIVTQYATSPSQTSSPLAARSSAPTISSTNVVNPTTRPNASIAPIALPNCVGCQSSHENHLPLRPARTAYSAASPRPAWPRSQSPWPSSDRNPTDAPPPGSSSSAPASASAASSAASAGSTSVGSSLAPPASAVRRACSLLKLKAWIVPSSVAAASTPVSSIAHGRGSRTNLPMENARQPRARHAVPAIAPATSGQTNTPAYRVATAYIRHADDSPTSAHSGQPPRPWSARSPTLSPSQTLVAISRLNSPSLWSMNVRWYSGCSRAAVMHASAASHGGAARRQIR